MAKQVSVLSVFVASPSDVSEERESLERVIRELNLLWQSSKGIRLELIRWETNAYPSFGDDPQSVINEQIDDEFDIFIGVLWTRFGTPTSRYDSGTEEEFHRAYERHLAVPESLRIMFYFKTAAVEICDIDPQQLTQLRGFKSKLGNKGALYWDYKNQDEFNEFLRLHLTRHVDDWEKKKWGQSESFNLSIVQSEQLEVVADEDEEGFLDLIEVGTESFESMGELSSRIGEATESLGSSINQRASEMNEANSSNDSESVKLLKKVCNRTADNMDQYTVIMNAEIPLFASTFKRAINCYARAAVLILDFQTEENDQLDNVRNARSVIETLYRTSLETKNSIGELRTSISGTPRMTTKYNHSRRAVLAVLDGFIGELQSCLDQMEECGKTLDSILNQDVS